MSALLEGCPMRTDIASITADVAAWLADHVQEDLPGLATISIHNGWRPPEETVRLQLSARNRLLGLATWAERLRATVTVVMGHDGRYVRVEIATSTPQNIPIALWNHLDPQQWHVLQTVADVWFDDTPREVSVEMLRRAAAALEAEGEES